jgi:predicted acylesterase/phospholipase RssA
MRSLGYRVAVVLSGGPKLEAALVGMLRALYEREGGFGLVAGTSVGAICRAIMASRPATRAADQLVDVWRSMSLGLTFPDRPLGGVIGVVGRRGAAAITRTWA